jgi:hypothetical protein
MPGRLDPLTDIVPEAETETAMAKMRETIAGFVARLPKYPDYLQHMSQKAA